MNGTDRLCIASAIFTGILCEALASAQSLSTPSQVVSTDPAFRPRSPAVWQRGFVIGRTTDMAVVYAADRNGKIVVNSKIWPAGAEAVVPFDMSVSPNGGFAVALSLTSTTGARTSAIGWLDGSGSLRELVQLSDADIYRVCF